MIERTLVVLAGALWLGGLTFYAAVVIPLAHEVLGSHTTVGFITRRVTVWINLLAAVALLVFLINLRSTHSHQGRRLRRLVWTTWGVMAAVQAGLFILHPRLDRLLDVPEMEILQPAQFYSLHQVYLIGTTLQMLAGLLFLVGILIIWRSQDQFQQAAANRLQ
ncbi:hypothetical protein SH139x_004118 [Planctomycetaceae bacterium SH139]